MSTINKKSKINDRSAISKGVLLVKRSAHCTESSAELKSKDLKKR